MLEVTGLDFPLKAKMFADTFLISMLRLFPKNDVRVNRMSAKHRSFVGNKPLLVELIFTIIMNQEIRHGCNVCVAQALSRGSGARHSVHASA